MNIVDAPALTAEQFADIRIALEAEHSDWRPSGQPTGLTYTDIFCGFGGSSIGLENAGLQLAMGGHVGSSDEKSRGNRYLAPPLFTRPIAL